MKLMVEPKAVGMVINVGNPQEITIGELAQRVKAMTGSSSPIVHVPYDQAYDAGFEDMPRRVPDLSRVKSLIGYQPTVALDEIIDRVIAEAKRQSELALNIL
jgi:UDP-glucose 4-epimerase